MRAFPTLHSLNKHLQEIVNWRTAPNPNLSRNALSAFVDHFGTSSNVCSSSAKMIIHFKILLNHHHSDTWIIISEYLRNNSNSIHSYMGRITYWILVYVQCTLHTSIDGIIVISWRWLLSCKNNIVLDSCSRSWSRLYFCATLNSYQMYDRHAGRLELFLACTGYFINWWKDIT